MDEDKHNHSKQAQTSHEYNSTGDVANDQDNLAIEMIRGKINALFEEDKSISNDQQQIPQQIIRPTKSKHQLFLDKLSNSGKPLAEIQVLWHQYYTDLPDKEKHEVWQEFYAENSTHSHTENKHQELPKVNTVDATAIKPVHNKTKLATSAHRHRTRKTKKLQDKRTVSDIKRQVTHRVRSRAKLRRNSHLRSLLFGLSMGSVVVVLMLFGFFNERIIAPFITPSRTVSSTPIITDLSSKAVGKDPKIIIPKINVEIPVVYDEPSIQEDAVQKALERGVLHYATTPNPGEKGNTVIFGHSSNNILNSGKYKFAFVLLSRLEKNDTFMLEKNGVRYVYKVFERKVVPPNDLSVLKNHGDKSTATLITCDPPGTSINRLVVTGEQISPSPAKNIASSLSNDTHLKVPSKLPSNSPSLWSRFVDWF